MLNEEDYENTNTTEAVETSKPNTNPLSAPPEGEAIYQQQEDGSWVGIYATHISHQFHAKGATKEICQQKVHDYIEGVQ